MLYIKYAITIGLLSVFSWGCSSSNEPSGEDVQPPLKDKVWYTNPVIDHDAPDPTIERAADGMFYLYATGGNTSVYKSPDLVRWDYVGNAYEEKSKPAWEPEAGIWAPDINYIDGKYVMYYSMSKWGGGATCGIGVSVSDTPEGPFTDLGKLFRSNEIDVHNSIDPFYIEDNGQKYLFWGSWYGIWGIELSEDGLSLKGGIAQAKATKRKVAAATNNTRGYEAAYILKRGVYYYLFCSTGTCCEGAKSTYQTVLGRSTDLFGPYLNKAGEDMNDNKHEVLISKNDAFLGTGHNAEIIQDDEGKDWILYHAYRTSNTDLGRVVLLDRVYWDDNDWPYVLGGGSQVKAEAPVFKKSK